MTSNPSLEAHPKQVRSIMGEFEGRALSLDSLTKVTGCLSEMIEEAVKLILECKEDIRNYPDLSGLVDVFFDTSLKTLDFFTELEKCLGRAHRSQLHIQMVLQHFEEEDGVGDTRYERTLEELKKLEAAGDPFTEELARMFDSVSTQQKEMLEKVKLRREKLDKKIKQIRAWRKVSNVVIAITYAAVLICSIVAAALAAPPVAQALAAATTIPFVSMGAWIDSQLKIYEDNMKNQDKVHNEVESSTRVTIIELENIWVLIKRLKTQIEGLLDAADLAIDKGAMKIGIREIKEKQGVFNKKVADLGAQVDSCIQHISEARNLVVQSIVR
ncbi:hypothetical protein NMG60_11019610 [Bertholletia excelsa]